MPNLNDLKKEAKKNLTQPPEKPFRSPVEEKKSDTQPIAQSVWDEIVSAGETVPNSMIFAGLVGPEGVGKTGIVLDSMTPEEKRAEM